MTWQSNIAFAVRVIIATAIACMPVPPRKPITHYRVYVPLAVNPLIVKGIGGDCATAKTVGAQWFYSWNAKPAPCPQDGFTPTPQGVPMIQGDWGSKPVPAVGEGAYLLLFNEPDLPQQANIAPERAAELQWQVEAIYPTRQIGAPAPSHGGREWLVEMRTAFMRRYGQPPKWDFLTAHCYFATAAECQRHIEWFIDRTREWNIPGGVWVTEWAILPCTNQVHGVGGQPGVAAAITEANKLLNWFVATPEVRRYAWFVSYAPANAAWAFQPMPDCDTSLRRADGTLTEFGQWYSNR